MKKIILLILFVSAAISFQGQNSRSYRQLIEINNVPKNVRTKFKIRYASAYVKMWYVTSVTYWYEDYGPSYYNGWYKARNVVVYKFDQPSYYEVEFLINGEDSRAIFNRYGAWFESRGPVFNLPEEIINTLKNSEFANWNWSEYKERIKAPGMQGSVYRLHVSKNHLSQIIRINDDGKIV
jgi:hypothetical protein